MIPLLSLLTVGILSYGLVALQRQINSLRDDLNTLARNQYDSTRDQVIRKIIYKQAAIDRQHDWQTEKINELRRKYASNSD